MLNSAPDAAGTGEPDQRAVDTEIDAIVRRGPSGAIALAGVSTLIVVALWFAFYLFVFAPRGGG